MHPIRYYSGTGSYVKRVPENRCIMAERLGKMFVGFMFLYSRMSRIQET